MDCEDGCENGIEWQRVNKRTSVSPNKMAVTNSAPSPGKRTSAKENCRQQDDPTPQNDGLLTFLIKKDGKMGMTLGAELETRINKHLKFVPESFPGRWKKSMQYRR